MAREGKSTTTPLRKNRSYLFCTKLEAALIAVSGPRNRKNNSQDAGFFGIPSAKCELIADIIGYLSNLWFGRGWAGSGQQGLMRVRENRAKRHAVQLDASTSKSIYDRIRSDASVRDVPVPRP
jgi:hypothetical protein